MSKRTRLANSGQGYIKMTIRPIPQPRIGMRSNLPHVIQLQAVPGEKFVDVVNSVTFSNAGKMVIRKNRCTFQDGLLTDVNTKPKKMSSDDIIKLLLMKCLQLRVVDQAGVATRIWDLRALNSEGRKVACE